MKKSNSQNPIDKTSQASSHKPLFEGEGTLADAQKENKARIKSLRKEGSAEACTLADKLAKCCPNKRCKSPACSECNWFSRRKHVGQMKKNYKKYKESFFVTLVPADFFFKPKALSQIKVGILKNTLRKRLKRAGLEHVIIIGGIEATYKFKEKQISLHWHLIFGNCSNDDVEKLRKFFYQYREMRVDPVKRKERSKRFSYCLKNVTYGKKPETRKKQRPSPSIHTKLMLFLDRHSFHQLMFLKGVKFHGDKLVITEKTKDDCKPIEKKGSKG